MAEKPKRGIAEANQMVMWLRLFVNDLRARITVLFIDNDLEPVEAIGSSILFFSGLQLFALPGYEFQYGITYRTLVGAIPFQAVVAAIFVMVGVNVLLGMLLRLRTLRLYGAVVSALLFGAIAVAVLTALGPTIGFIVFTILAGAELWVAFRLAVGEAGDGP